MFFVVNTSNSEKFNGKTSGDKRHDKISTHSIAYGCLINNIRVYTYLPSYLSACSVSFALYTLSSLSPIFIRNRLNKRQKFQVLSTNNFIYTTDEEYLIAIILKTVLGMREAAN